MGTQVTVSKAVKAKHSLDLQAIQHKIQQEGATTTLLLARAKAYIDADKHDLALQDYEGILRQNPHCLDALYYRGTIKDKLGQLQQAIEDFSIVIQTDANHVNAWYARATCRNKMGDYGGAIDDYKCALDKDKSVRESSTSIITRRRDHAARNHHRSMEDGLLRPPSAGNSEQCNHDSSFHNTPGSVNSDARNSFQAARSTIDLGSIFQPVLTSNGGMLPMARSISTSRAGAFHGQQGSMAGAPGQGVVDRSNGLLLESMSVPSPKTNADDTCWQNHLDKMLQQYSESESGERGPAVPRPQVLSLPGGAGISNDAEHGSRPSTPEVLDTHHSAVDPVSGDGQENHQRSSSLSTLPQGFTEDAGAHAHDVHNQASRQSMPLLGAARDVSAFRKMTGYASRSVAGRLLTTRPQMKGLLHPPSASGSTSSSPTKVHIVDSSMVTTLDRSLPAVRTTIGKLQSYDSGSQHSEASDLHHERPAITSLQHQHSQHAQQPCSPSHAMAAGMSEMALHAARAAQLLRGGLRPCSPMKSISTTSTHLQNTASIGHTCIAQGAPALASKQHQQDDDTALQAFDGSSSPHACMQMSPQKQVGASSASRGTAPETTRKKQLVDAHHHKGFNLRKAGRFQEAIVEYTAAMELQPDHFKSFFNRGFSYDKVGEYDKAIQDYTAAIALDPVNSFAFYNRGITRDKMGEYDGAIQDFTSALDLDPQAADFYHNRGFAYRKIGEFEKAIDDYSHAIQLAPGHCRAWYNRACCHDKLDHVQEAIHDYSQSLALEPNNTTAHHNRGALYERLGMTDKALEDYDAALRLDSSCASTYDARGCLKQNLGKLQDALVDMNMAVQLRPTSGAHFLHRALCRRDLQDAQGCLSDLDKALELQPDDVAVRTQRGHVYRKLSQYELAVQDYSAALEACPGHVKLYNNRAYCYAKLGRYAAAIQDYDAVLRVEPNNTNASHNRAITTEQLLGSA